MPVSVQSVRTRNIESESQNFSDSQLVSSLYLITEIKMAEETVDTTMLDENVEQEQQYDMEKIKLLPGSSEDGSAASFQIKEEDHTLGNALRYIIMKNPEVEFFGYSIPHPSEAKLNIRIQTYGNISAVEALHQGMDNLSELCDVIEDRFNDKVAAGGYKKTEV